ncbi:EAL domain-containing protein [Sandarakinorhabdus sp.]|uniref:putative bifunctional diguanylate cyclase/phosphodiesterase n=1 Tax=Sandarakinorhabdus sp. TaxID=1916663 RepID=UPI00286EA79B|nr:EAL domain-containing protein [Sandarakinorhabdus sp.]
MRIAIVHSGGTTVIIRRAGELGGNWAMGNLLRFSVPVAGKDVRAISINFQGLDSAGLLRCVEAMSPAELQSHNGRWTALVGVVFGILICALAYNAFLLTWSNTVFQRIYVGWVAASLVYLLVWTGALNAIWPGLAGPATVRIYYPAIGILGMCSLAFLQTLMEDGVVPRWLARTSLFVITALAVTSIAAGLDMLLPASATDLAFNLVLIGHIVVALAILGFAFVRNSRSVWFYLVGWAPPLVVFGMRLLRNFGLLPQSGMVDMLTFGAFGWEAVLFSLAIADRFRQMRKQHEKADDERESLRSVAMTDALTGLANRAVFQQRLVGPDTDADGCDLIVFDVDYLKQTNDIAGHDAGDALIIDVARRLCDAAGPDALVARIGGDEFVVLLEGAARERLPLVHAVVASAETAPLRHAGFDLAVSICAGHAEVRGASIPIKRLYKHADLALYRAKSDGRGCWRTYDSALAEAADARTMLIEEARAAVRGGGFILHYQPVCLLSDRRIHSYEALLRWQHPRLGLIGPPDFPEVLREASLLPSLQLWVLRTALDRLVELRRVFGPISVSVNFVTSQLHGRTAAHAILSELASRDLPNDALTVEVTETVVMGGIGSAITECLSSLRLAGVRVALDDFGTGFASLVHLRDVPSDIIKIDRSFVTGLPDIAGSNEIVSAIISLAHNLGKQIVAEGVETESQRHCLLRMGCQSGQGFLLGHPIAEPELPPLIDAVA